MTGADVSRVREGGGQVSGRQPPRRVVVTGAPRAVRPGRRAGGGAGAKPAEEHLRALVRAQLRTSLVAAAVLAAGLGSLPLLFALVPAVARFRVAGVRLVWPLLGVLAYPLLYGIGRWYVSRAEANEMAGDGSSDGKAGSSGAPE